MDVINSKKKIIAWLIIIFWLSLPIIFRLINIEFSTIDAARIFRQIWLILIPTAVGILFIEFKKNKPIKHKYPDGLITILLLSAGIIFVLNFFSSMCEWQFSDVKYKHKTEELEIRMKSFDCGAWDSDPSYQLVKTRSIGAYLYWYSEIKAEDINPDEWVKNE